MSKYMLTFCPQHFHNNKWGNSEHSLSPEFPIWGRVSEKIWCGNFVEIDLVKHIVWPEVKHKQCFDSATVFTLFREISLLHVVVYAH